MGKETSKMKGMTRNLASVRHIGVGLLLLPCVASFHQSSFLVAHSSKAYRSSLHANEKFSNHNRNKVGENVFVAYASDFNQEDDYLFPETSFGAEAVPEGQRPVNEYLNLMQQPLFGWASEKTGTQGLLARLILLYLISFVAM
jgi:hypothetical protein